MAFCLDNCKRRPPQPASLNCNRSLRSGGISRLVFAVCDIYFNNICDPAEWYQKVQSGEVVVSGDLTAQKPKANPITRRLSSCIADQAIGYERSVTFLDYNADNEDFLDYEFWAEFIENPQFYKFGFITCAGLFYGFVNSFTTEIDQVIEDSSTGLTFWDGSIKWNDLLLPKPLNAPWLVNILNGGQYISGTVSSCDSNTPDIVIPPNNGGGGQVIIPGIDPCPTYVITSPSTSLCSVYGLTLTAPFNINTTYQWYRNGNLIPGQTQPTLLLIHNWVADPGAIEARPTNNGPGEGTYYVKMNKVGSNCPIFTTNSIVVTEDRSHAVTITVIDGQITVNAIDVDNPVPALEYRIRYHYKSAGFGTWLNNPSQVANVYQSSAIFTDSRIKAVTNDGSDYTDIFYIYVKNGNNCEGLTTYFYRN